MRRRRARPQDPAWRRAEDEREALLAELSRQRQRLSDIVGAVPGIVWEAWGEPGDAKQCIDFVSAHVEAMLGYRVDEWLSIPDFWLSIVHPEDRERAAREAAAILAAGGVPGVSRFRWFAKDGRVLWAEAHMVAVCDERGRPMGLRGVTLDITLRKRAEADRELLLIREKAARSEAETAQGRLKFLADAGVQLTASMQDYETTLAKLADLAVPCLADWCVINIPDEAGAIRNLAIAHPDPAKVRWAYELAERYPAAPHIDVGASRVLKTGISEFYPRVTDSLLELAAEDEDHLRLLRGLGVQSALVVPLVARGRTIGALTLAVAESGHRYGPEDLALAEQLARRAALAVDNARLYREAQDAVRSREQFLSIASHELRTPVTVVRGYTEGLIRFIDRAAGAGEPDSPRTSVTLNRARLVNTLHKIEESTDRLVGLIEGLLDTSRLQAGQLAITPERADLDALLARVLEQVKAWQESGRYPREITVRVDRQAEGGVWGTWDRARIEQVLVNLIDNAIKYSPPDSTITIALRKEAEAGPESTRRRAHLVVSDQGIGVPMAEQSRIFEPFSRASNASARSFPGLGLGLAISREIVERHGGRIWVESDGLDAGSAFHIILPGLEDSASLAPSLGVVPEEAAVEGSTA